MRKLLTYSIIIVSISLLSMEWAAAQRYPERSKIRKGNREYYKGNYAESELDYRRALEENPHSFESYFNFGNSLYKQGRYEEASELFSELGNETGAALAQVDKTAASNIFYNAGNSLLRNQKIAEAIEGYKNALRINPDDQEAKFNLAYAKKLLDDDNDGGQDDQNQDQDQDQNQDQDQDQNQDGDGEGDGDDDQEQDDQQDDQDDGEGDGEDNEDDQEQEPQESEGNMSRSEADQILDALQGNEEKTREKVDEENAKKAVIKSDKNW